MRSAIASTSGGAIVGALLFGYFFGVDGQPIFTCLSHDIIAHEVAHAALSRLHGYYNEPTNPHVPALHEAFADIVAVRSA